MPFIRRFETEPSDDEIAKIEGINIIDGAPASEVAGSSSNEIFCVGESLKGPYEVPTRSNNQSAQFATFGAFSPYSNPGGARPAPGDPGTLPLDGNMAFAMSGEKYGPVVFVRVKDYVGTCSIIVTSNEIETGVYAEPIPMRIPAGIRVSDAAGDNIFAICEDIDIAVSDFTGSGPYVATIATQKIRRVKGSTTTVTLTKCPAPDASHVTNFTISASTASAIVDIDAADMITNYETALEMAMLPIDANKNISMIVCCRHDAADTILLEKMKNLAIRRSAVGKGCIAIIAPPLNTAVATAIGSSGVGVGNTAFGRNERVVYVYPGMQKRISELKSLYVTKTQTTTGIVNFPADFHMAAVLSQIPPEQNPGQQLEQNNVVKGVELSANITALDIDDYIDFKANGICALIMDSAGPEFQSGVTSVNPATQSTRKNISTRRMRDYIQDSIATSWGPYRKKLQTDQWKKDIFNTADAFLASLKDDQHRITDYSISTALNAPAQVAKGFWRLRVIVQLTPNSEAMILDCDIGETVVITEVE